VRRLVVLLVAVVGLVVYLRLRLNRSAEPEYSPAEELRSKLAESRSAEAEAEAAPEPEPELESALELRRREVHQRARSVIDDLS
jgi:hypothetical protein